MAATRPCFVLGMALAFLFMEGAARAAAAGGLPAQQRRQVRSLLRRLNKPPVETIQSPDGDTIDCVHISKQPAFDHPSLKNHTIQMKPSYHPEGLYDGSNMAPHSITQTWHQIGRCPVNTIPIRRTMKEDVLRASSIRRYGQKRPRSRPNFLSVDETNDSNLTIGHQYALAYTPKGRYYGTKATINLWQPTVETDQDFSLAQLWISGGSYSGNDLNTIEAGWQVYPELYGDSYTRLFIYWTSDAYQRTGCYNLLCSGFIQTNNQVSIGASFSPMSIYGGLQYETDILVWKDTNGAGNWWLQVGDEIMGYWPSTIFSYLQLSASYVAWGGEVYSPLAGQTSTDMGSGHFPGEGFGKASYMKNLQVVDSFNTLNPPLSGVGLASEQPNCYNVQSGTDSVNWGTYIFYGGPGKNPSCP
ncbi:hypothetical protein HU200_066242 [Digitaria exilis]|uniref:Neprosin PEP catalytic domain-containing protein n=1 Tax=Digitaria exilis TaxID=1010633 RepID=A0A834ZYK0_9POAL|nr:hypothetical protein HU200_066242 [Digitaria exilis]